MDRALSDYSPVVARHIFVTPRQLRMIADRIEAMAESGMNIKGQIVYQLLPDLTLYYDPQRDSKFQKDAKVTAE